MALFSDGGIFATKPYICGSNYYRKMGGYKASENWCEAVDGLYWGFIEKHQAFFLKNPRLSMMARSVEKMDPLKKQKIFKAAEALKFRITC
jgi:deoxyribodipyrimidine photolyase-related protein